MSRKQSTHLPTSPLPVRGSKAGYRAQAVAPYRLPTFAFHMYSVETERSEALKVFVDEEGIDFGDEGMGSEGAGVVP